MGLISPEAEHSRGDRSFIHYYTEVGKTRPIDALTERKLFILYKKYGNQKARDQLINNCLRFVVKLARRFTRDTNTIKELIGAGNEGILLALKRYDPKRDTRFLSYATYWILLCMRNELHNRQLVRMPFWRQKAVRKIQQARAELETNGDDVDDPKALSAATDLSTDQVERLQLVERLRFYHFVPLAANAQYEGAAHAAADREGVALIAQALDTLPVKERFVVRAYFGFIIEPWSLRQIANLLNVTPERVRQIKVDGLTKLQRVIMKQRRITSVSDVCMRA